MNTITTTPDLRRSESRYRLSERAEVRVSLYTDDSTEPASAHLVDLSTSGIQLKAATCLKFEQSVRIHVAAGEVEFDVVASVKWLREADESRWYIGCRIEPELSESILTQLASMGIFDRRARVRRDVRLEALVCGQLDLARAHAVVRNISDEGFGFSTLEPRTVGERIRLQVRGIGDEAVEIAARVVWQLKTRDGYFCGCSLMDRECSSRLHAVADAEAALEAVAALPIRGRQWSPLSGRGLVVLSLFVFAVSSFCIVSFRGGNSSSSQSDNQTTVPYSSAEVAPAAGEKPPIPTLPTGDAIEKPTGRDPQVGKSVAMTLQIWRETVNAGIRSFMEQFRGARTSATSVNVSTLAETPVPVAGEKEASQEIAAQHAHAPASTEPDFVEPPPAPAVPTPHAHGIARPVPTSEFRAWADDSGQHRVVARIVSVQDGKVRLLKQNGRYTSVSLDRLSFDDRRYVERWLKGWH